MLWQTLDSTLTRIRPYRESLSLVLDAAVIVLAWQATYLFRLGFSRWMLERPHYDTAVLIGLVALYLIIFILLGVPKGMWRFSGFGEIKRLTVACFAAGMLGAVVVLMAQLNGVPRAVLAMHPVMSLIGLSMVRIGYRMLYEHMRGRISGSSSETRRALVLGAGNAARRLVAGIQHEGWVVVGMLDDAPSKQNARVAGVPVLGPLASLPTHVETQGITHLIIAMPTATPAQRRRVIDIAAEPGLPVYTVPNAQDLQAGHKEPVRDIQPEDLLGREPVVLEEGGIADVISGKCVLVTGAGGSIGSELCRQLARFGPQKLVLFEQSEFALYQIEQELSEHFPHIPLLRLIGDVKDLAHVRHVFMRYRPHVVFHAAAYKHVPLMEDDNAWAAVRNNTLGTYNASLAAAEAGADRFVLISTDKAVNPTNVMGATKRAAELVLAKQASSGFATRFMAVRFGNVLGSSGSVIPKFKEQIAKGGPVTVTHEEITRYFMTIPEAARLVVQAAAIGETGQVFVLDMGDPVKIVDLARDMIRLSGHSVEEIGIQFTGLRPGEKLYEELLAMDDTSVPTRISRLRIAKLNDEAGAQQVLPWLQATALDPAATPGDEWVRQQLRHLIPEFRTPARS